MNDSFTFAVDEQCPLQHALNLLLNQFLELRKSGAPEDQLQAASDALLASFESFRAGTRHSNPAWVVRVLEGNIRSTLGDFTTAIDLEREALQHAADDIQRSKSHNNLCDYFRCIGRTADAVEHGLAAVQLCRGRNAGILITCAQALHAAGRLDDANGLIRVVARSARIGARGDILTAHALFDDTFALMSDLSAVKVVMNELRALNTAQAPSVQADL